MIVVLHSLISLELPTISIAPKLVSSKPDVTVREHPVDENAPREIKLYSAAQFRSHINRLYPFHLDFFSEKLSALDFSQHRMGLYVFYDVNLGHLINDVDKESKKKTDRGKNMKVRLSSRRSNDQVERIRTMCF